MNKTILFGICIGLLGVVIFRSLTSNRTYEQGVKDTHKEAFEMGLMKKEITKDDEVIYRWIETHKLGYE